MTATADYKTLAERASKELAEATAEEALRWTTETFGDDFIVASNMQDAVLVDLASRARPGVVVLFFETGYHFAETIGTRNAVAAAYLLDPSLATDVREVAVDIDTAFGPDYGRSLGHAKNPPVGTQRAKVVFGIDLDRFFALYADLLSRPVGG